MFVAQRSNYTGLLTDLPEDVAPCLIAPSRASLHMYALEIVVLSSLAPSCPLALAMNSLPSVKVRSHDPMASI